MCYNITCQLTAHVSCLSNSGKYHPSFIREEFWMWPERWSKTWLWVFHKMYLLFSSVQSLSYVWLFVTPWIAARQASSSIINSWSLPKLTSIDSVMPSSHLILCCPLFFLPSIFSSIRETKNKPRIITIPLLWYGLEKNLKIQNNKRNLLDKSEQGSLLW